MCNKIKCAKQYTEDLINNNIKRDVETGCTRYIHVAAIRMMRIVNVLQLVIESCKCYETEFVLRSLMA